jgi:hypothetical protein
MAISRRSREGACPSKEIAVAGLALMALIVGCGGDDSQASISIRDDGSTTISVDGSLSTDGGRDDVAATGDDRWTSFDSIDVFSNPDADSSLETGAESRDATHEDDRIDAGSMDVADLDVTNSDAEASRGVKTPDGGEPDGPMVDDADSRDSGAEGGGRDEVAVDDSTDTSIADAESFEAKTDVDAPADGGAIADVATESVSMPDSAAGFSWTLGLDVACQSSVPDATCGNDVGSGSYLARVTADGCTNTMSSTLRLWFSSQVPLMTGDYTIVAATGFSSTINVQTGKAVLLVDSGPTRFWAQSGLVHVSSLGEITFANVDVMNPGIMSTTSSGNIRCLLSD